MSISDKEVLLFVAPWMALGFGAALTLAFLLDVRGAITAFCVGGVAPALTYLAPGDLLAAAGPVGLILGLLRVPVPFNLTMTGKTMALLELTMDWWVGAALGTAVGLCVRQRPD